MSQDRHKGAGRYIDIDAVDGAFRADHIALFIALVVFIDQFLGMYHIQQLFHLHSSPQADCSVPHRSLLCAADYTFSILRHLRMIFNPRCFTGNLLHYPW